MIPVPEPVLEEFTRRINTPYATLRKFAGGRTESDGVIYSYPYQNSPRLLKIMAISQNQERKGLFCLDERLKFMRYLGENGASIAYPLPSPQNHLFETIDYGAYTWIGYSMELIPGKTQHPESWDETFIQEWGRTIGNLHRLAKAYSTWEAAIDPVDGERLLTWENEWKSFYDWCQDRDVKAKWVEIRETLKQLPLNRQVFGFIHNDPHIWNLLAHDNKVTVLDFDVSNHHWFINDIAIACQSILIFHSGGLNRSVTHRDRLLNFLTVFMQGYRQENQLPVEWIDHLDTFIAYRRILHFIVMNDYLRKRPKRQKVLKDLILTQPEVVGRFS